MSPWIVARLVLSTIVGIVFALTNVVAEERASNPTIGMLLPLTGSYAAIGVDNRQGFEVALEELKAEGLLNLQFADSRGEPMTAVSEFRKLVEVNRVVAVFTFRGPVGMALAPLSKAARLSLLGGVGNKNFATESDYTFQLWSRSDDEGGFLADELLKRGLKKISLVTAQDDWTDSVSIGFRERFQANGGEIVVDQEFLPGESDFRTAVSQIKAATPQAIFVNLALPQIGIFVRQAREQRLNAPLFSNFWAAKKEVIHAAGSAIEGVEFPEMSTDLPLLREKIKAKYGSTPTAATVASYVAAHFLVQARNDQPTPHNAESFYRAMLKQKEVKTLERTYPIVDRCVKFPLVMRVIKDGKAQ